jgi:type III secretion system YscD/HrpQ family protein
MTARFVIESGDLKGLVLSLEEDKGVSEWIVGRDPDLSTLLLEDPKVSRKHLLVKKREGSFFAENFSETNPALVNDIPIKIPVQLKNSDVVKVGDQTLRFLENSEAQIIIGEEEEEKTPSLFEEEIEDEHAFLAHVEFGPESAERYILKVISGPNNGAEFYLAVGKNYTLGTDVKECEIIFNDTSISRRHAYLTATEDSGVTIKDLKSSNGTHVDGETITDSATLSGNSFVTIGTTSFVIMDREQELRTIISPLLPSIVDILKKENKEAEAKEQQTEEEKLVKAKTNTPLAFIALLAGILLIAVIGVSTLFRSVEVLEEKPINYEELLSEALTPFPSITYSYNEATGNLLLVGHVLMVSDKNQLLYNLQGLNFIKKIDSNGIVIDEYVWKEINQIVGRNPEWKGINVYSPKPGTYVMSGYLKTRKQAEELSDYITSNFPYLDRLERKVIVEEEVVNQVESLLNRAGVRNVSVLMNNGELTLRGGLGEKDVEKYKKILNSLYDIPGIRGVKNFVAELSQPDTIEDVTARYKVAGFTRYGKDKYSVVISGSVLTNGDVLDGMTITSINRNEILLEKGSSKYRIRYGF